MPAVRKRRGELAVDLMETRALYRILLDDARLCRFYLDHGGEYRPFRAAVSRMIAVSEELFTRGDQLALTGLGTPDKPRS